MDLNHESFFIEKAKLGDEQAWAILFKWHFKPVYNFCVQMLKGNQNDAEEVAQQTFIIAAQKIYKRDPNKGAFRLWLFGIAKNCLKRYLSKKKNYKEIDTSCVQSLTETTTHSNNLLVLETLACLPAHYSIILEDKYIDKKTLCEIAQIRNATEKAVESMLSRAKEKFKQVYQQLKNREYGI